MIGDDVRFAKNIQGQFWNLQKHNWNSRKDGLEGQKSKTFENTIFDIIGQRKTLKWFDEIIWQVPIKPKNVNIPPSKKNS